MNISFRKMDHVTLIVSDLQYSRRFYGDVLGMHELERPQFDYSGAWFATTAQSRDKVVRAEIHLTLSDENSGQPGWGDRKVGRLSRGHHIAFEIDDIHAAVTRLQSCAVTIDAGPKSRPDGPTQIFFRDPDDHVIELFTI